MENKSNGEDQENQKLVFETFKIEKLLAHLLKNKRMKVQMTNISSEKVIAWGKWL